jgi:hypothetical protein
MTPDLLPEVECCAETITHYRCTACGGWWAVYGGKLNCPCHCPHCGRHLAPAQYPGERPGRTAPPNGELPL